MVRAGQGFSNCLIARAVGGGLEWRGWCRAGQGRGEEHASEAGGSWGCDGMGWDGMERRAGRGGREGGGGYCDVCVCRRV